MKLSEIVTELTKKKPDGSRLYTQESLAKAIGTNQPAIGQILAEKRWNDHWNVFMKLFPIAWEHDLIEEQELHTWLKHERRTSNSDPAPRKAKSGEGRKPGDKKTGSG